MRVGSRRSASGSTVIDEALCFCEPDLGQTLQEQRLYWPPLPIRRGSTPSQALPARLVVMWFAATAQLNSLDSRWRSWAAGDAPRRGVLSLGSHDASGTDGVMNKSELGEAVEGAWRCYGRAAASGSAVAPAVPILFFGDVDAYFGSRLRVVTVGLNPSSREFPADDPFGRFPLAEGIDCADVERYVDALAAYFRVDPYAGWFGAWEPLLNGAGASYYPRRGLGCSRPPLTSAF